MPATDWKARIDPELRGAYRQAPNITFGPWVARGFRLLLRAMPAAPLPAGVVMREVEVGTQRLRLFSPAAGPERPAALMLMHGGGRVVGVPQQMDPICARITAALGILTVSASYRLAPEHPYPAALDDLMASLGWLHAHAGELGIDPARIGVGGESAGGGLAAELCQRARDEGGPQVRAQVLFYPMLDDRTATKRELTEQGFLVWDNRSNHYGWSCYLGGEPGASPPGRYAAAARCEQLQGLPPAWFTVGDIDLFTAEVEDYCARLARAGVPSELHRVEGGFHGFVSFGRDQPPVLRMYESLFAFLREHL